MNSNYNNYELNVNSFERISKNNIGKNIIIYATYGSEKKEFKGIIEDATSSFIIISDPTKGEWYLILLIDIDYIKFLEKVNL